MTSRASGPQLLDVLPDTPAMSIAAYRFAILLEQPTRIQQPATSAELEAVGQLGLDLGRAGRAEALSCIAARLGLPGGGWSAGQSKLFEKGDARIVGLLPGGAIFDRTKSLSAQVGQRFGAQSILEYLVNTSATKEIDLDRVFKDPELNQSAWIKSAKVRAVECMFLERLLSTVRDLKVAVR